jgi:CheY-like chemotaxis protein
VGSTFTLYLPLSPEDQAPLPPPAPAAEQGAMREGGFEVAHTVEPAPATPALQAAAEAPSPPPAAVRELEGRRILVVDDDVRNLFAIASLLERRGAEVLPAGSAKEGFEVLDRNPDVALVLMDMMMPEIDGYQATRQIRRNPRHRDLPVIALTAKAMPGDRGKALEAGCNDFVPKPVEQQRLLAVLRQWIPAERQP